MPVIAPLQMLKMANYIDLMDRKPGGQKRGGFTIPGTTGGMVWEYACWNWALSGGVHHVSAPESAVTIWEDIIHKQWEWRERMETVSTLNEAAVARYPGSEGEFQILHDTWDAAQADDDDAQKRFKKAMLRIAARKNGLNPVGGAASTYTLHMKTREWDSWHHMGLGVKLPHGVGTRQTIIQTVPNCPVQHCCSVMWDEGMAETVIGISDVLPQHITVLNRIGAPTQWCCRICQAVPQGIVRPKQGWHQCNTCFAVYCRTHKANLVIQTAKTRMNPHTTRVCNRPGCHGTTHVS